MGRALRPEISDGHARSNPSSRPKRRDLTSASHHRPFNCLKPVYRPPQSRVPGRGREDRSTRLHRGALVALTLSLLILLLAGCAANDADSAVITPTVATLAPTENKPLIVLPPTEEATAAPTPVSATATSARPRPTAMPTNTVLPGPTPTSVAPTPTSDPVLPKPTSSPVIPTPTPGPAPPIPQISTAPAFPRLGDGTFGRRPVLFTYLPDGSDRVVVVEQDGLAHIFENDPSITETAIYLDLSDRISRSGNEEGFLGLAFHPEYALNGQFYVYYSASNPRRSVISRFTVSPDPDRADIESETVLLKIPEPRSNHNGGSMVFGPDGYLYIGIGDGGGSGDPSQNGQDPTTLLGTIIRIDVDRTSENLEYGIPPDNPFAGSPDGERPEIWAYGLRNPWRFSFDRETGSLWVGDVGQNAWEEIDVIERGGNYGWNILEGTHCFLPASGCDSSGTILPVAEYGHNLGCSITGGHVYRGPDLPALADLQGVYIYGDFCTSRIWGFRVGSNGSDVGAALTTGGQLMGGVTGRISSFGEDATGNIYIVTFGGQIHRIVLARQP